MINFKKTFVNKIISVKTIIIIFISVLPLEIIGQGSVANTSFFSNSLGFNRSVQIYLPEGYNPQDSIRYPVIYFLHGSYGNHTSYPSLISIINNAISSSDISPTIVVKPDGSAGSWGGSMYTNSILYGNFEDYIVYDLIEFIDSTYKTIPLREKRTIMGWSMGGYGSMKLALKHPAIYCGVAAHSGPLDFNQFEIHYVPRVNQAAPVPKPPYIYSPGNGLFTQLFFLCAGAFSPNLNNPPYLVDFPLDTSGILIDSTFSKWFLHDPASLASNITPDSNLAIYFDCGMQDELLLFHFNTGFRDSLDVIGLNYIFKPYAGGHSSQINTRYPIALSFLDSVMNPIAPNFVSSLSPDVIDDSNTPAVFTVVCYNMDLTTNKFGISLGFEGPAGWTKEFTTINGTFMIGQVDSIELLPGDSTHVTVTVNPNGFDGYGSSKLEFSSGNNSLFSKTALLRNVTTTGIDILVVDAEAEDYENFIMNSLDNVYIGTYGVIGRTAFLDTAVILDNFEILLWTSANSFPAFYPEEVYNLESYLNNGGKLFISGQDIGSDIFEPTGQSQFAQYFYNNYLHADYLTNSNSMLLINGYPGDPITDGIQFVIPYSAGLSLEGIAPFDADATPILKYMNGPNIGAIKAVTNNYRVVYLGIGFEQISDIADRDSIMARSIRWLGVVTGIELNNKTPQEFSLKQNHPNPFNPSTSIGFILPKSSQVELVIYNIIGQKVETLVNGKLSSGIYNYKWNASNYSSGIYFYRLETKEYIEIKKMILMK